MRRRREDSFRLSDPLAFARPGSPAWVRLACHPAVTSPTGRFLLPLAPAVLLVALATAAATQVRGGDPSLAGVAADVASVAGVVVVLLLAFLGSLAAFAVLARAEARPGVFVEAPGGTRLVPVLTALRRAGTPEADALLDRLLRDGALAAEVATHGSSTSGRLLAAVRVGALSRPDLDDALRRDALRALTVLPLEGWWLSETRGEPFAELRGVRTGLALVLADVEAGVPPEWAVRRLARGTDE